MRKILKTIGVIVLFILLIGSGFYILSDELGFNLPQFIQANIPQGPDNLIPSEPRAPDPTNPNLYTGEQYIEDIVRYEDIRDAVITITNYVLGFLGLLGVIIIIYAGFKIVVSQDESGIKSSGKIILNVILGILVIFLAFAIVNFIANIGRERAPDGSIYQCYDDNGDPVECEDVDASRDPITGDGQQNPDFDPDAGIDTGSDPTTGQGQINPDFDPDAGINVDSDPSLGQGQQNPDFLTGIDITSDPIIDAGQVNPDFDPNAGINVNSDPSLGQGQQNPDFNNGGIDTSSSPDLGSSQVNPNFTKIVIPGSVVATGPGQTYPGGITGVVPRSATSDATGLAGPPSENVRFTGPFAGIPSLPGLPSLPSVEFSTPVFTSPTPDQFDPLRPFDPGTPTYREVLTDAQLERLEGVIGTQNFTSPTPDQFDPLRPFDPGTPTYREILTDAQLDRLEGVIGTQGFTSPTPDQFDPLRPFDPGTPTYREILTDAQLDRLEGVINSPTADQFDPLTPFNPGNPELREILTDEELERLEGVFESQRGPRTITADQFDPLTPFNPGNPELREILTDEELERLEGVFESQQGPRTITSDEFDPLSPFDPGNPALREVLSDEELERIQGVVGRPNISAPKFQPAQNQNPELLGEQVIENNAGNVGKGRQLEDEDIFEPIIADVNRLTTELTKDPISEARIRELTQRIKESTNEIKTALPKDETFNELISNFERVVSEIDEKGANANQRDVDALRAALVDIGDELDNREQITANVVATPQTGEVPMTVFFDASKSIDPSGATITRDNIRWSYIDQSGKVITIPGGVFTSHTFNEAGSYVVRADISSVNKDSEGVLDAVSVVKVNVLPESIKMNLTVNGREVREGDLLRFTLEESTDSNSEVITNQNFGDGLFFDPSSSRPSEGGGVVETLWDFGDSNARLRFTGTPTSFYYPIRKEGLYTVVYSLRDNFGNKKLLTFNIEITRLLPDFRVSPSSGTIDTIFNLDSSNSRSNNTIISRVWEVFDESSNSIVKEESEQMDFQAEKPGIYTVRLTIEDDEGNSNFYQRSLNVISSDPKSTLEVIPNPNGYGGEFIFDASKSFDPDLEDVEYTFFVEGKEVETMDDTGNDRAPNNPIAFYKFDDPGIFDVEVEVLDISGNSSRSKSEVKVNTFFTGDIIVEPKVAQINQNVNFEIIGEDVEFVFWDFGDGNTERSSDMDTNYQYKEPGVYDAKITIFQKSNSNQEIELVEKRKVYVGDLNSPIPVPSFSISGIGRELIPDICSGAPGLVVTRQENLKATGKDSVNIDGTNRLLEYVWDFGDGTLLSGQSVSHRYTSVENECYQSFLTVRDKASGKTSISPPLFIKVVNKPPQIKDVKVTVNDSDFPSIITVKAVGALDLDGEIREFVWRYGFVGNLDPVGVLSSTDPEININLEELGLETGEYNFFFDVTLIDDEGESTSSSDYLLRQEQFKINLKEKVFPEVTLNASQRQGKVGDVFTFEALPVVDGKNVTGAKFDWDFNGDSFFDSRDDVSKVSYIYEDPGVYDVSVNVKYAGTNVKKSQTVQILPDRIPLEAGFIYNRYGSTVVFQDTSSGDDLERREWDLNLSQDSDGDGNSQNDVDATTRDVSMQYNVGAEYTVSLTVYDSVGKSDKVRRRIIMTGKQNLPVELQEDPTKDLQAILYSVPPLKKENDSLLITLTPLRPTVTFVASSSIGDIQKYVFDLDTRLDSDGDGDETNDEDNFGTPSYEVGDGLRVDFNPTKETIRASLRVYDEDDNFDVLPFKIEFTSLSEAYNQLDQETQILIDEGALEPIPGEPDPVQSPSIENAGSDIDFLISQVRFLTKDLGPAERLQINRRLLDIKSKQVVGDPIDKDFNELQNLISDSEITPDRKESAGRILLLLEKGITDEDPEAIERGVKLSIAVNELEEQKQNQSENEDEGLSFDVPQLVEDQDDIVIEDEESLDGSQENNNQPTGEVVLSGFRNSKIWPILSFLWSIIKWFVIIILSIVVFFVLIFQIYKRLIKRDPDLIFEDMIYDIKKLFKPVEKVGVSTEQISKEADKIVELPQKSNDSSDQLGQAPTWLKMSKPAEIKTPTQETKPENEKTKLTDSSKNIDEEKSGVEVDVNNKKEEEFSQFKENTVEPKNTNEKELNGINLPKQSDLDLKPEIKLPSNKKDKPKEVEEGSGDPWQKPVASTPPKVEEIEKDNKKIENSKASESNNKSKELNLDPWSTPVFPSDTKEKTEVKKESNDKNNTNQNKSVENKPGTENNNEKINETPDPWSTPIFPSKDNADENETKTTQNADKSKKDNEPKIENISQKINETPDPWSTPIFPDESKKENSSDKNNSSNKDDDKPSDDKKTNNESIENKENGNKSSNNRRKRGRKKSKNKPLDVNHDDKSNKKENDTNSEDKPINNNQDKKSESVNNKPKGETNSKQNEIAKEKPVNPFDIDIFPKEGE